MVSPGGLARCRPRRCRDDYEGFELEDLVISRNRVAVEPRPWLVEHCVEPAATDFGEVFQEAKLYSTKTPRIVRGVSPPRQEP